MADTFRNGPHVLEETETERELNHRLKKERRHNRDGEITTYELRHKPPEAERTHEHHARRKHAHDELKKTLKKYDKYGEMVMEELDIDTGKYRTNDYH